MTSPYKREIDMDYRPPVHGSDASTEIQFGFPGGPTPPHPTRGLTDPKTAIVRWDAKKFPGPDVPKKIEKLFKEEIGSCNVQTKKNLKETVVEGFLNLVFEQKEKAKDAEDKFDAEVVLEEKICLAVRDLERRNEELLKVNIEEGGPQEVWVIERSARPGAPHKVILFPPLTPDAAGREVEDPLNFFPDQP